MARRVVDRAGGIFGLLDLVDEHQEAIEFELLVIGRRLAELSTAALSWRDLFVLVRRWQKTPGNAFAAVMHGGEVPSWSEQVLAVIVDMLNGIAFILRKGKGSRPKRLQRWWEKRKQQKFGREPIPLSKFDAWWESASKK
ncbi:hypothetical protein [Microbacterium sp. MYb62]|uniref:hypothetical protein n=1 Tax=Microbacterium sp. MYb62 TaxID=1848690 RepID=UPI000CFCDEFC|nr:hypothetical protein [Microbacterium sp. MYb62]PRB14463.1 hypothetical protein CQ042_11120 [Microbacterium sp. MYb62]